MADLLRYSSDPCPGCGADTLIYCTDTRCPHVGCNGEGAFCTANLYPMFKQCRWKSFGPGMAQIDIEPIVSREIAEELNDGLTVAEARATRKARVIAGEEDYCVVCQKRSHIDGRPIDKELARCLNLMRQWDDGHPGESLLLAEAKKAAGLDAGNVATMLRHWRLIEPDDSSRGLFATDPKALYRITALGRQFLNGEVKVPKMAYTFEGNLYAVSDEHNPYQNNRCEYIHVSELDEFDLSECFFR